MSIMKVLGGVAIVGTLAMITDYSIQRYKQHKAVSELKKGFEKAMNDLEEEFGKS